MSNKYFCCSDIHGFYTIFKKSLEEKEFDINNKDHILIICGDLFDRGSEAKELLDFLSSIPKDRLLLIKGNHEDLLEDCLFQLENHINISSHHWYNGTVDTIAQLTDTNKYDLMCGLYKYSLIKKKLSKYFKLIKNCKNYLEIKDYIFVHGWIPHIRDYKTLTTVDESEWCSARWLNGMAEWHRGNKLDNKTIVCGHWHVTESNMKFHNSGSGKFDKDGDFLPFIDRGIIAIDGTVAFTGHVNVIVIDECGNLINNGRIE